jgi:hypothetical protein
MSMESLVANTGPFGATMSAMTVDMVGSAGTFGHLNLPGIKTSSSGTAVKVDSQRIKIVNMEAYKAFVKSIMLDEELILRLDNGHARIKSWGMSANIVYQKEVKLKGMRGPKTIMVKTEVEGGGKRFKNTMKAINPSSLELDLGTLRYEFQNEDGVKIAEQKGKVYLMRGESAVFMEGTTAGVAPKGKTRIVSLDVEEDNWHNETIPFFNTEVELTEEFVALCNS